MSTNDSYLLKASRDCTATLQYAPFQLCLVFHSSVVIAAFYATFYFLEKHIQHSPIHRSFKFLLTVYFVRSWIYGASFLLISLSCFTRVFLLQGKPEDSLMSPVYYKYLHILYATTLIADVSVKMLLVLERALATCRVRFYESESSQNAIFSFILMLVFFPFIFVHLTYEHADFESPNCFAVISPKGSEFWVNLFLVVTTLLGVFSYLVLKILIRVNKRKRKTCHHSGLSTRYQISENLVCSHLVSTVLVSGLCVTVFYAFSMTVLRLGRFQLLADNRALYNTATVVFYPLPVADLLIPIYSGSQLKRTKTARTMSLNHMLHTSRQQITDAYEKQLKAQWA